MAPTNKRPIDDDFVYTLSDNDDLPIEEEEELAPEPPRKKAKTSKNAKKGKQAEDDDEEADETTEEGVWGKKEADDGAMDSDFEFQMDAAGDLGEDEFEGWGFEGAKKNMKEKKGVDLDEIIRRRREKKNGKKGDAGAEADVDVDGEATAVLPDEDADGDDEIENDMAVDLDDDDDEVLADDAFGMNVDAEDEEGDEEDQDGSEDEAELQDGDEPASDDDSVATPMNHPDDDEDNSDASDQEDPEEEAKRNAFFAPEEKAKPGKNKDSSSFLGMNLSRPIMRGLTHVGFTKPTPIQDKTIPIALMGKDIVGGAVTGSGKTGAFIIPILERLIYRPNKMPTTRVVVLTPTRELAIQCHAVATKIAAFTDIKFTLAVGGLSLKMQEAELRLRPDVIIATPGRFIDHMRNSASFNVDTVEILVLDEADRMLEDGFADELNEILTTMPKSRQTMLFSATMTSTVDRLVRVGMNKPVRLMVDSQKRTVGTLVQEFVRLRPGREDKRLGYLVHLCKTLYTERVIVFFRQKKDAHRARIIFGMLGLSCGELHGSMNQTMRIENVEKFRDGKVSHLLATDLASRGLDIKGVDTVINYEAPQSLEIYVHRVGRTARAGRTGVAVTLAAEPDRKVVKAAVRAGKAQGAKVTSRTIDPADADKWQDQIDEMDNEIEEIMKEEKREKQLAAAEMQVRKGENLIEHENEIKSRPKRTWFETQDDKQKSKQAGADELNGVRDQLKKKTSAGKLSNKDKKRLDNMAQRKEGNLWKGGKNRGDEDDKSAAPSSRGRGRGSSRGAPRGGRPDRGDRGDREDGVEKDRPARDGPSRGGSRGGSRGRGGGGGGGRGRGRGRGRGK
ncbi:dependent RNA helicase drs-1 [Emericellopsis atlantica]|uniref:RNA helicase n=1 Tax=Emericellopsis atlantica TaxID=2614577 RepID=A0A9P7ZSS9_9HYPO|nr:dependent RNA helicase drs-1 [Emericellopsis atlantica]KAG9257132.1 dependent RNA helicase drs-1 [Emericellopsis atlantica]